MSKAAIVISEIVQGNLAMTEADPIKERREQLHARSAKTGAIATVWIAVSAFATIGLTLSTYLILRNQLNVMQAQLDVMKADQRPYVALSNDQDELPFLDEDGRVNWNYHFSNYGKGIAYNARVHGTIRIEGDHFRATVNPGPAPNMYPTQKGYITAVTDRKIGSLQFSQLKKKSAGIVLLIDVEYTDNFSTNYREAFCIAQLSTGATHHRNPDTCRFDPHRAD
jgi:hypothetical protein